MGLNQTPSAERTHIAFLGCRNAGKSSLLNAVTGQKLAIVSDIKGTTTDPVYKSMELLPAGPVVLIDTPGLDDEGSLGEMRIEKAKQVLRKADIAILVIDSAIGISKSDELILENINERNIPHIVVFNKSDLNSDIPKTITSKNVIYCSTLNGNGINELKDKIAELAKDKTPDHPLIGDLIKSGDLVLLVIPIDKAAPKGRLILPQQQTIRDLLDHGAIPMAVRDTELQDTITRFGKEIRLVVTDSQAFMKVNSIVPTDIPLTSFSILFSRYKGELEIQKRGSSALKGLKTGDKVLIAEGCTHHRQCGDIGTEKLPALIKKFCGCEPVFEFSSGTEFPENIKDYKAIIHCGGCMLNEREMKARINIAEEAGVPISNYGMAIAMATGVFDRSIKAIDIAKERSEKK